MSDLLSMSFDCLSSPTLKLRADLGTPNVSGWGFGWYPNDDSAASVVKDTGSKEIGSLTSTLSDWQRFRSTTFLCKVRGAAKRYSQQDTQPFHRSFGGRDWLFLHNGDLDKEKLKALFTSNDGFLEPMGVTDSELAFCYILQQLQCSGAKRLADVPWDSYLSWFSTLDSLGAADIVLADGQNTLAYHGPNSPRSLFYLRRIPPHQSGIQLDGNVVSLDFSDSQDTHRTAFLVSSEKFSNGVWSEMASGQMIVVNRASITWNTHTPAAPAPTLPSSVNEQSQQTIQVQPFTNSQFEQSQSGPQVTNTRSIIRDPDGKPLEYRAYKVTHTTDYVYSKPVERSTHILRLQPVEDRTQEVLRSTLTFSGEGEQIHFEDVFGNQAIHVTVEKPYSNLSVQIESDVRIYARPADDFTSPMRRIQIPLVWMPWQRQMMLPYLLPPELPETQLLELTEYAMGFVERADYNLVDTLTGLNQQIFNDYSYVQGKTTVKTTPFDVYMSRVGVCQDFANLFICLARLLNIPSRYRVGYIHTGSDYANQAQSDASHAWVEVYLPYLGWRGYDPTNGVVVAQEHIRVACGRNFRDATPMTGTLFKGGGTETLSVSVKVKEIAKS
jgi:transglutaminase-like putative cysteine protease/predicted glutamine amidotransferase